MATLAPAAPLLAGGPPGWIAFGVIAVLTVGAGAVALSRANTRSGDLADTDTARPWRRCPCRRTMVISRSASPQAAQHILDAQASGHPRTLTLDGGGTAARRAASLSGISTIPDMDRDEDPPATFLEGGAGASVRHIPRSDNRSAGGQMSAQLAGVPDGCQVTMTVGP